MSFSETDEPKTVNDIIFGGPGNIEGVDNTIAIIEIPGGLAIETIFSPTPTPTPGGKKMQQ